MAFAEYPRKALKIIDFRELTELEKFQATEKQPGGKLWQEACGVVTFDRSKERTFHVEHCGICEINHRPCSTWKFTLSRHCRG